MLEIGLGKNVCSLARLYRAGCVTLPKRLKRNGVVSFETSLPVCGVEPDAGHVTGPAGWRTWATRCT